MGAFLNLAMIGNTIANAAALQRILSGILVAMLLTVIAAALGSVLLMAGIYALYIILSYSFGAQLAAVIILALVSLTAIILSSWVVLRWRKLPHHVYQFDTRLASQVAPVVDAFVAGFKTSRARQRNYKV